MSASAANLLAAPKREALAGSGDEFQLRAELSSSVFAARLGNRDPADVSCAVAGQLGCSVSPCPCLALGPSKDLNGGRCNHSRVS